MTVKIQFEFATALEAANFLAKQAGEAPGKPDTSKPAGTTAKPTPAANAGSSNAGASSTAGAASPKDKEPEKVKAETKPDVPTYEKSGIPEKIKAAVDKDKPGVIKLLGEFGVKKGGELKPEQFADFTAKIDALLAGGGEDLS